MANWEDYEVENNYEVGKNYEVVVHPMRCIGCHKGAFFALCHIVIIMALVAI